MIYNNLAELKENNPNPTNGICLTTRYGRGLHTKSYIYTVCPNCGKGRWVIKYSIKEPSFTGFCINCIGVLTRGEKNGNWKGGTQVSDRNYRLIKIYSDNPYYSMANPKGYIKEHRLVMAQYLGRCLTDNEVVHHKNGVKSDNRFENLRLDTRSQHSKSDRRELQELRTRVTQLEAEVALLRAQLEKTYGGSKV